MALTRCGRFSLARRPEIEVKSIYSMTRKTNPLLEELPSFFKKWDFDKLAQMFADHLAQPERVLLARVSKIALPFDRGLIEIKDQASIPEVPPSGQRTALTGKIRKINNSFNQGRLRAAPCAKRVNDEIGSGLVSLIGDLERLPDTSSASNQWKALKDELSARLDSALLTDDCRLSGERRTDLAESEIVETVVEIYQAALKPSKKTAKASFQFENQPLQRFSLGAMNALIIDDSGANRRGKLSGGVLQKDGLDGNLAALLVNIHPVAFDPNFVPDELGGASPLICRSDLRPGVWTCHGSEHPAHPTLSLNVGVGELRIDELRSGEQFGEKPLMADDPFRNGKGRVTFIGLGFSL